MTTATPSDPDPSQESWQDRPLPSSSAGQPPPTGGGAFHPAYPGHPTGPGPAPFGNDPVTGQPYSEKSRVAAGLLQILPSFLLLGGIGRLYAGHTGLGIGQLLVGILIGWTSFWCGFLTLFLAWFVTFGIWLWFLVDGILVLTGRPVDQYGRLLRP